MEAVFLKLLNMSITAGWVVLVIVVLRQVLKRAPKSMVCFLWAFVALRLLCPISVESVLSLIPSAETVPQDIMYHQNPQIHSGILMLNTTINPILSEGMSPAPGDSVNPMQVVIYIVSRIWIMGMLGMVLYAVVSYYKIHKQVAVSLKLEDKLYVCDDIESPFILGIMRPRIYLPSSLEEEKQLYVIAHEKAHLKRCDHWWKPVGFLLLTVYWFHPLMWLAYVLLCKDIELACDEKVIKELGEAQKRPYSEALLYCSVSRRRIVACPLAFGEVGVKERVKSVLHYKKPAFWVIMTTVFVCVIVAVCFLTNPKEKLVSEKNPLGYSYYVKEVCYSTPKDLIYSTFSAVETMPLYGFNTDMEMYQKSNRLVVDRNESLLSKRNKDWQLLGGLQEIKLTENNFDNYFKGFEGVSDFGWHNNMTAKTFREENKAAWEVLTDGEYSYYLLQQKDGGVYLAAWYYDSEREQNPTSDDSSVRRLFRLERADKVSCVVEANGRSTFFAMDWYPDWPLEEYYEDMSMAEVDDSGTLAFQVDGTPTALEILEERYWKADDTWCKAETSDYTLTPNHEGKYVVGLERTQQVEEYSVFTVLYQDGKYIMRVRYPERVQPEGDRETDNKGNKENAAGLQNVSETQEWLEEQSQMGQQEELSPLDMAIRKVILGNETDKNIKGVLFNCASHITLATETVCGVPLENGGEAKEYVTVYAWVMTPGYVYKYPTNAIVSDSNGYGLAILKFEVGSDGEYIIEEHLNVEGIVYARDRKVAEEKYYQGSKSYKKLFQEMLPREVKEAFDNEQMYFYWLTWDCYEQAIQDAGVDTDSVITGLLDEALNNEYAWQAARELTYYGKYTLQYCFEEFERGGQTGDRGKLMEEACKKIAKYYGEPKLSEIKSTNGQEWFDMVKENSRELEMQYGLAVMAEEYPISWMILELEE